MDAHTADVLGRLAKALEPADAPSGVGPIDGGVLLALRPGPAGPEVVLTVRPAHLADHPGQVALPGGHVRPGETALGAALREAHEEVGIPPRDVRVLGHLGDHVGPGWKTIRAVVGAIGADVPLVPDAGEVDEVFCVPLARLASRDVYEARMLTPDSDEGWAGYTVHVFHVEPEIVWGFTGGLLADLLERALGWHPPRAPRVVGTVAEIRDGLP